MPTKPCAEDIHTPNPLPARGVYGFSLYISSFCFLILYTLWAVVPTPILNSYKFEFVSIFLRGISYVPAKYWVILIPLILVTLIVSFVLSIFLLNIYRFRGYGIFEEVEVVEKDFGESVPLAFEVPPDKKSIH
ncbi:unnamed protein product [Strongylus vulgaris]|uniref:PIG-P domain-containing protein n=1 Tax=Strongylus vulgaris TaxID=40348 RepID=A0A3P7K490_STRVU|nr:unnamed protein product [Strongylus vulgaris]